MPQHVLMPLPNHWHGIRLPLEMDGVPYVSQLPVLPGEFFDYRFQLHDAGSFWYHPHTTSAAQVTADAAAQLHRCTLAEERRTAA